MCVSSYIWDSCFFTKFESHCLSLASSWLLVISVGILSKLHKKRYHTEVTRECLECSLSCWLKGYPHALDFRQKSGREVVLLAKRFLFALRWRRIHFCRQWGLQEWVAKGQKYFTWSWRSICSIRTLEYLPWPCPIHRMTMWLVCLWQSWLYQLSLCNY